MTLRLGSVQLLGPKGRYKKGWHSQRKENSVEQTTLGEAVLFCEEMDQAHVWIAGCKAGNSIPWSFFPQTLQSFAMTPHWLNPTGSQGLCKLFKWFIEVS